jgi:hypothetical protein
VHSAAALVRHPIPVTLLVSRSVSVPIPLDPSHSVSTYMNKELHGEKKKKKVEEKEGKD